MSRTRRSAPKKHYCFTINNPTLEDLDEVKSFGEHDWCAYLIYQHEVGENGTYHLQGYIGLNRKKRYHQLHEHIGRASFRESRGNPKQNKAYCSKDDTRATEVQMENHFGAIINETPGPHEYGELPSKKGSRSDLKKACDMIISGAKIIDLVKEDPVVVARYSKGIKEIQFWINQEIGEKDRDEMKCYVLNGPTGSGKSHKAHEMARADPGGYYSLTIPSKGAMWFDGYQGETTLLMDEFRFQWMPYATLLKVLDKWPLRLPIKGNHTYALWTTVIITTTHPVGTWYKAADIATGELQRRITEVIQMEPRDTVVPGSKVGGNIDPHQMEPTTTPNPGEFTFSNGPSWVAKFDQMTMDPNAQLEPFGDLSEDDDSLSW